MKQFDYVITCSLIELLIVIHKGYVIRCTCLYTLVFLYQLWKSIDFDVVFNINIDQSLNFCSLTPPLQVYIIDFRKRPRERAT